MLASTVQFSTYDQTPITRPRRTQHAPQDTRWYEMQTGPDREETTPRPVPRADGPLSQDPTACLRPRAPRDPCSTRHRSDAVLGTDRSRRPNWSAFHPRAPPHTLRPAPADGHRVPAGCLVFPLFSSNPLPPPEHNPGEVLGPSTTNRGCTGQSPADTHTDGVR